MAAIIPKLHHLRPPSGGGRFQLHRFSPYFDHPEQFGIRWTGAHPMFAQAFPLPKAELDALVYLHEFESFSGASVDTSAVEAAVQDWRVAYRRGASLILTVHPDGSSYIVDTRRGARRRRTYALTPEETELYIRVDSGINGASLRSTAPVVEQWLSDGLAIEISGRILSLATYPDRPRRTDAAALQLHPPPPSGFVSLDEIKPVM
jgi:hypothetical protein